MCEQILVRNFGSLGKSPLVDMEIAKKAKTRECVKDAEKSPTKRKNA